MGCSNLQSITVESTNSHFASIEGILFSNDIATIICFPSNHTFMTYNIPTSVTSIGDYAFSECSSLQSLTIPISVTSIGDYAFFSCSNLRSISIPHILGFLISKIFPQTPLFEIVILPIFILDRGTA